MPHQNKPTFRIYLFTPQSSSEYSGPAIKLSASSPLRLRSEEKSKLLGNEMRRGKDGMGIEGTTLGAAREGEPFLEGSQDSLVSVRAALRVVVGGVTY
jgi:hypothetical protein